MVLYALARGARRFVLGAIGLAAIGIVFLVLFNLPTDRSHNETFDALVMTGLLRFGAYILLFISIFYSGLKWLGMITSPTGRNAFIALWLVGGFAAAFLFGLWRGWHYVGVALPAGMILGLFVFLVAVLVPTSSSPLSSQERREGKSRRRRRRRVESVRMPTYAQEAELSPVPIFAWTAIATLIMVTGNPVGLFFGIGLALIAALLFGLDVALTLRLRRGLR